ncbi:MAG: TfoX/Sxy family protein [Akkermansia sp.]
MFGEYGLYCDRKYFGLVCDNQLFVKVTAPGLEMLPEQEQGSPYPGAKPHFLVTELDDDRALSSLSGKHAPFFRLPTFYPVGKRKNFRSKETGVCDACLCRKWTVRRKRLFFVGGGSGQG